MKQYLETGKLINTHGVRGEMKMELWCDGIDYLKNTKVLYLDENGKDALHITSLRAQKSFALITFEEITSIEDAEKYKNKILHINRDDAELPEEKTYIDDLIGCYVVDADSEEEYGKVVDVVNYGASDILDVESWGKHKLIPFIDDIVKEVNLEYSVIKIKPLKGLFDED